MSKVHSAQIDCPWLDLSALRVEYNKIPGEASGSWSTGELNSSNRSFPLITSQMIVAKDIKIAASKFSKEVINAVKI